MHDSARTGFRFVLEDSLEAGTKLHFSTKGWWDWKAKKGDLSLDQLWLSGYSGDFDYQIGRQVISWGTADGFNPTNYFARMSMEALSSGVISGNPLWAAQAVYYGPSWSVTGVAVPFFTPQAIDDQMKQMMMAENPQAALILKAMEDTKKPRGLGKNSEWAVRAETQIAGFDVQASLYSGYEPLPGLEMVLTVQPDLGPVPVPSFEGVYRRQTFAGLALPVPRACRGMGEATYGGQPSLLNRMGPIRWRSLEYLCLSTRSICRQLSAVIILSPGQWAVDPGPVHLPGPGFADGTLCDA